MRKGEGMTSSMPKAAAKASIWHQRQANNISNAEK